MSKGRRYDNTNESKLNMKKVVAVGITLIVIVMFFIILVKTISINKDKASEKNVTLAYYTVYENEKWGVINSKGETVIEPSYGEMIVIPNPEKDVFIVTYDVDYTNGTYKAKAINSKNEQLFTSYDSVEAIQNQDKQNSVWYITSCLKVEKNGQYGLIDFSGKNLLECQYDEITAIPYIKNSLITTKDNRKGLISATGTIIINNEYDEISALTSQYEDGYIVKNNGKFGVVGTNKKVIIPVEYEKIENVKSGEYYIVKEDGKLKIYNSTTEQKTDIDASAIKSMDNENIIIEKSGKYGLLNVSGEESLEAKYQDLTYVFSNYYIAKLDDKYGIIDNNGNVKIDFIYKSLTYRKDADFIEGEKESEINTEIISRNLKVELSGIISEVNVTKGYMKIRVGSEYKYYNFKFEEKKNTEILTGNTLFLDKKDGKYGYVNKEGIVVVNYIYDDAMEQNDSGYVAVKKDEKWGAIDQNGRVVVDPTLTLDNNSVIDFIGTWHIAEDANAGYYTK